MSKLNFLCLLLFLGFMGIAFYVFTLPKTPHFNIRVDDLAGGFLIGVVIGLMGRVVKIKYI